MRRTTLIIYLAGLIAGSFVLAQHAPPPPAQPPLAAPAVAMREEVKIVVENKADDNGEIRFDFTPEGGSTKAIRVTVAKKMSNQEIADDLAKELKVALGADYKVEQDGDDKIKVSSKNDSKFSLTVSAMTANGLSVRLN